MTRMSTDRACRVTCLAVFVLGQVLATPAVAQNNVLADWMKRLQATAGSPPPAVEMAEQAAAEAEGAESDANGASVKRRPSGLIDIHVRNASIAAILDLLSYEFELNIVSTDGVDQRVSANLYGVSLEEALEAILKPRQYTFLRAGKVIYVGTVEELSALLPPPETRVFYVQHLSRKEAARAARTLLSATGQVVGDEDLNAGASGGAAGAGAIGAEVESVASVSYLVVTDYPDRLNAIGDLLKQLDVRPKQVLIEATILRATLNEDNQFGVDFTLLGGVDFENVNSTSNAANNLATGALPAEEFQETTFNVNTAFTGGLPGGFSFGIIRNSVAAFVRALEDVTDVTVVANPKVVALNRQSAEVIVGRRDGYLTTTVTETAAVQTVEFLETGTQIRFRPVISDDGTVRLDVHPKDSNGGLTADNLPFEETTEAQAQVVVRDGHTVLIGGLFRERTISAQSQLPVLGDLPGAGVLFQRSLDQTVREEVIILLTIHVLDSEVDPDFQAEVQNDIERIRAGARRGLLGSGRERLAQAYYQEALTQIESGDLERALLNVRMALHNNPRHLAALRLRDQLMHTAKWDNDGTRGRTLLLEMLGQTPDPVTLPDLNRPAEDWRLLRGAPVGHADDGPVSAPAGVSAPSVRPVPVRRSAPPPQPRPAVIVEDLP